VAEAHDDDVAAASVSLLPLRCLCCKPFRVCRAERSAATAVTTEIEIRMSSQDLQDDIDVSLSPSPPSFFQPQSCRVF
jgi:hypothetical protein